MGKLIYSLFFFLWSSTIWGKYNLPTYYKNYKQAEDYNQILDYMVVEVNKSPVVLRKDENLQLIKGDEFMIKEAVLRNSKKRPSIINVVGFRFPGGGIHDGGGEIDSAKIRPSWAVKKNYRENTFVIVVHSKKTIHGLGFLKVIEPQLSYADISINGKKRVMREGETLRVKTTDQFKVEKVVTNIEKNKGIRFQIRPKNVPDGDFKRKLSEELDILFSHKEYIFARIPIVVEKI